MFHNLLVFLETVFFLYISFVVGAALLPRLGVAVRSGMVYAVQAVLLGLGVYALAGLAFGFFGVFNTVTLWAFTALLAFCARKRLLAHVAALNPRSARRALALCRAAFREHTVFKILIIVWLAANGTLAFVPITAHDTLDYHLPIVLDIVAKGQIDFTTAIEHYSFTPVLAEVLYAVPAVMFREIEAPYVFQLLQFMTLPLFLALVYGFVRQRVSHRFLALAAVLGILGIMDFEREILHGGYVDTFAFLYGFASTLPLLAYATRGREEQSAGNAVPALAFSAVMLAVSLGMKYFGFFFGAFNLLFLLVGFKRFAVPRADVFRKILLYAAIVIGLSCVWYAKNWLWFDNPLYPMFSNDAALEGTREGIRSFIIARAPWNFIIFPFVLFGQWFVSEVESSSRLVILGYFIALYGLLGWRLWRGPRLSLTELLLFIFIQGYLAFHFALSHYLRYLLPPIIILPALLALLADGALAGLRARLAPARLSFLQKAALAACICAAVALFLGNLHYFQNRFSYILGIYSEGRYMNEVGSQ